MRLNASNPSRIKLDLRDACQKLSFQARDQNEMAFLSAIYKAFVAGGTVTVKPKSGKAFKHEFPGI